MSSTSEVQPQRPAKKRQHNQLRALLFNRLGLFEVPSGDDSKKEAKAANNEAVQQPLSQQYLKDDKASEGGAAEDRKRRGMIRFNSIVSVVAIPNRGQYSTSVRNLLWGKKNSSRRGSLFKKDDQDLDNTDGTHEDPATPAETTKKPVKKGGKVGGRHRLMRKKSFHS